MLSRSNLLGIASLLLGIAVAASASAAPVVNYTQLEPSATNELTVVQVSGSAVCPVGTGSCLAGGPLGIDSASVSLDLGTNELLDLNIFVGGPGEIEFGPGGFKGYQKIVFTDAVFQSSGTATLGAGGAFSIQGEVSAGQLDIFLAGGDPMIADITVMSYTTGISPNAVTGIIGIAGDQLSVFVTGFDIGRFPDLDSYGNPTGTFTRVKADFDFVAAVPEPGAALLYGIGILIAGTAVRRRAALRLRT